MDITFHSSKEIFFNLKEDSQFLAKTGRPLLSHNTDLYAFYTQLHFFFCFCISKALISTLWVRSSQVPWSLLVINSVAKPSGSSFLSA